MGASQAASAGRAGKGDNMDFEYSDRTKDLLEKLGKFMDEVIYPAEPVYEEQLNSAKDRWQPVPVLEECKAEAKKRGLWNMFLPADRDSGDTHGTMGLSNLEYAPICEMLGRSSIAPEATNCSAPDTGNMEVFARYASPALKEKWLKPLLNGEIRSCFAMTEPAVASSDARNIESRIESDGDHYVINGRKWWSSGMGDPRCKVIVFMGKSDPSAPPYRQQSMIVVPADTPGIKIVRMLHVFGYDDAPHGHAEVVYDNVRVPKENILLGEGRGFEIAQGRLGPGRIHHCMRAIGVAERALEMAIKRAKSRVAFGQRVSEMGVTKAIIADCRMEIDMARLLVLKAAWAMDNFGNKEARQQIAMIKVAVPNITTKVVDRCIQLHGGGGVSQVFKLANMYAHQRTLRLADGPDEVHRDQVGRLEIQKHN
jgi:acyl-CoA dehydrogenase